MSLLQREEMKQIRKNFPTGGQWHREQFALEVGADICIVLDAFQRALSFAFTVGSSQNPCEVENGSVFPI